MVKALWRERVPLTGKQARRQGTGGHLSESRCSRSPTKGIPPARMGVTLLGAAREKSPRLGEPGRMNLYPPS